MSYFKNPKVLKILDYYKNLWSLSYLTSLSHWDLETYMPPMAVGFRGEAMARVSTIRQKMFLDKSFAKLIADLEKEKDLNAYELGISRVLKQSLKFYQKIPSHFLEELSKLTNRATVIWREAKDKSDYKIFEPYLKKIFEANIKTAEYLGYKDSPYDALLDLYEEDLKSKDVASFFDTVIPPLKTLLTKIVKSKVYSENHFLEARKYDKNEMVALNEKILKHFWKETGKNFRLDISSHPFTTSFSKYDTRITTWYHQSDFARSMMATVHEFGHALYDLQGDENLEMTPIAGGSSLVIHESQSRFWENHIGRSREFIEIFKKDIEKVVGRKLSIDDIYTYLNQVKPSLLRVEADEVTYHMHIALRFEIERGVVEGKIKFKDIRDVWNSKMKDYLGIAPKKDSEGILQDIHWSGGSVGYFPTYSLGTFLSAQWKEKIIGDPKKWLGDNIHKFGSTYTLNELLMKNKMKFDPTVNLKYLEEKYSKIYKF